MDITFDLLVQIGMYNIALIGLVIAAIRLVIDLIDRSNKKK